MGLAYSCPEDRVMGDESEMMHEEGHEMMGEAPMHLMGMNKMNVDKNSPLYVTNMALKEKEFMKHIANVSLFKLQYMRKLLTASEANNLEDMRRDIADLHQQFFEALKAMEKGPMDVNRLTDIHTKFMDKAKEFKKMKSSYIKAKMPQMKMEQRTINPSMQMRNQEQMSM